MKKNVILTMMSICMFMTAFSTAKMNVNAGELEGFYGNEEVKDTGIYGIDGEKIDESDPMYSDYYSNNDSTKSKNLMTRFMDFVGWDNAKAEMNEFLDNSAVGFAITQTGLYEYLNNHLDILEYTENAIDAGMTKEEVLKGYAINTMESMSPIHCVANRVVSIGGNLMNNGEKVSDSTASMIKNANEREKEADEYFSSNPEKKEEIVKKAEQIAVESKASEKLYVVKESFILMDDNENAKILGLAEYGACLTVTGKTNNGWYEVKWGYSKGYLPPDVLSPEDPIPPVDLSQVYGDDGRTAEEILAELERISKASYQKNQTIIMMYDGSAYVEQVKCKWESDSEWMELLGGQPLQAGSGVVADLVVKEETLLIKFVFDNGKEVDDSLSWETIQKLSDYYGGECLVNFSINGIWDA